ncbi:aspartate-semialdehyde dehydrogenase [Streptomyces morookaense]|uniref:aspartate-semialdehyde dehydrogenase n=1 Tax=Streptomyces morookaense TaxID=1970 RepID=A0A7Y7E9Y3_STRMO|nr:aspartate-semialdehyde dehydrogenase [Streptomyces morookaense]NVK80939.1 aspartate-semialdehyde dehydrogenase [Streptomyces morookaense]GHF28401.1 aspartate-semialdehyde dehydrogenase [Streptomyces morookaense]
MTAARPEAGATVGTGAGRGHRPTLAVVGATGAVGAVMLELLSRGADIWGEIRLISPAAGPAAGPAGRTLSVRGAESEVRALDEEAFEGADVAVFLVPDEVAAQWVPVAVAKGAVVVDTSGAFRMDPDVPLVVPEINAHAVRVRPRGIVAGPGCTTLPLIAAMGALHAELGLSELVVSSYEAVSAAGQAGVAALRAQLAAVAGTELGTHPGDVRRTVGDATGPFPAPVALNVVPWAGSPAEGGWSSAETAVREESRKILGRPDLPVSVTCVRVPVITGHSLSVHARFENEVTAERAHEILANAPGVVVCDSPAEGEFPTPADVVGTDPVWAGRLRCPPDDSRVLDLFLCGDNLRKGAALNAAQIAELVAAELTAP